MQVFLIDLSPLGTTLLREAPHKEAILRLLLIGQAQRDGVRVLPVWCEGRLRRFPKLDAAHPRLLDLGVEHHLGMPTLNELHGGTRLAGLHGVIPQPRNLRRRSVLQLTVTFFS
jgi:hypothetical protein